jgi:hypothetical protein
VELILSGEALQKSSFYPQVSSLFSGPTTLNPNVRAALVALAMLAAVKTGNSEALFTLVNGICLSLSDEELHMFAVEACSGKKLQDILPAAKVRDLFVGRDGCLPEQVQNVMSDVLLVRAIGSRSLPRHRR